MTSSWKTRRLVAMSAIAVGSLVLVAVPEVSSVSGAALVTTTTSTTTTTTAPKTTTAASATKASKNYEVVDGIFSSKANAQARIDKLKSAKFKSFKIKNISPQFAVVRANLTKAAATKLAKQINVHGKLGKARIKKLA